MEFIKPAGTKIENFKDRIEGGLQTVTTKRRGGVNNLSDFVREGEGVETQKEGT